MKIIQGIIFISAILISNVPKGGVDIKTYSIDVGKDYVSLYEKDNLSITVRGQKDALTSIEIMKETIDEFNAFVEKEELKEAVK